MSGQPLVVAWARFQPRSAELARELGGEVRFVAGSGPAPLRYAAAAARTWGHLRVLRPRLVLAVTPPVFAPLVAWLWCLLHGAELVVDCHAPGSFDARRWRWARPLHRVLLRRCRMALVHTRPNEALLVGWRAPVLLLTDDVPEVPTPPAAGGGHVLVAGSFDGNEPVATALAAAALLPHLRFAFTGDPALLPAGVVASAPPNVTFTGYLPYAEFLAAVAAASAVAVFTDDADVHTPRAAFEAAGAGRPLVLLDFPGARGTFGSAAVFARREPRAMAAAIDRAVAEGEALAGRSRALAGRLRERRAEGLAELRAALSPPPAPGGRVLVLTQHSLERHCIARRNVDELLRRGYDVDVVCTEGLIGAPPATAGRLRTFVVPIAHRRGGLARYVLEYAAFFAVAAVLVSWLGLRGRYVLVQSDNLPDSLVFASVVPRLRGARVVFNMFELTPEMIDAGVRGRLRPLAAGLARWTEARAVRWADRVIVVSEACRAALANRGAPADKLAIVVNTTSWIGLPEAADGWRRGYLVTHGTLVERYGTHLILEALARLPADVRLRVVGTGEQLPALMDLAHALGIDGRVQFTGQLSWGEALAQVRGAALGIVAVLEDGYGQLLLPTKLLEYARLGVPVVCPRLAAIEAYFPPGAVAYFPPGDAARLAAQVERLLGDPELARAHARRAREVVDTLSWERMRDRYIEALGLAGPWD
jgi:glycosyltransferase involved in cell wall biosynthesis